MGKSVVIWGGGWGEGEGNSVDAVCCMVQNTLNSDLL